MYVSRQSESLFRYINSSTRILGRAFVQLALYKTSRSLNYRSMSHCSHSLPFMPTTSHWQFKLVSKSRRFAKQLRALSQYNSYADKICTGLYSSSSLLPQLFVFHHSTCQLYFQLLACITSLSCHSNSSAPTTIVFVLPLTAGVCRGIRKPSLLPAVLPMAAPLFHTSSTPRLLSLAHFPTRPPFKCSTAHVKQNLCYASLTFHDITIHLPAAYSFTPLPSSQHHGPSFSSSKVLFFFLSAPSSRSSLAHAVPSFSPTALFSIPLFQRTSVHNLFIQSLCLSRTICLTAIGSSLRWSWDSGTTLAVSTLSKQIATSCVLGLSCDLTPHPFPQLWKFNNFNVLRTR